MRVQDPSTKKLRAGSHLKHFFSYFLSHTYCFLLFWTNLFLIKSTRFKRLWAEILYVIVTPKVTFVTKILALYRKPWELFGRFTAQKWPKNGHFLIFLTKMTRFNRLWAKKFFAIVFLLITFAPKILARYRLLLNFFSRFINALKKPWKTNDLNENDSIQSTLGWKFFWDSVPIN